MKKSLLLIILLTISTFCFSQKTLSLKWKVGDSKNITMNLHSKIINGDNNPVDSILVTKSKLTIEDENKNSYKIKLDTYNQLINFGLLHYPDLLKENSINENLTSNYVFYKDSLYYEILDRAGYEKALKSTYDSILLIFDSNSIENIDSLKVELTELFNSLKEKSEAMHILDVLVETYETKFSKNDTIFSTDSIVSPLNGNRFLTTKEKTFINKKSKKINEIKVEKECVFDIEKDLLPDLKNQIKEMFKTMTENVDTTEINSQMQTIINSIVDSYKFDGSELFTIAKSKKSNWPSRISKEAIYEINNAAIKSEMMINISIEIK